MLVDNRLTLFPSTKHTVSPVKRFTVQPCDRLHSALGYISPLEFEKLLMEKENQKSNYTLSAFSKTDHAPQKSLNTTGQCQASVSQRISGHSCAPGCSKERAPFFAA